MNTHDNDFDRQMRKKFEGFRPDASPGLWDKISAELDTNEAPVKPLKTKKKRHTGWWMSAAAVLLLGMFAFWLYRPVDVVYLQSTAATGEASDRDETEAMQAELGNMMPDEEVREPLNLEPIRALFAGRTRRNPLGQSHTHERPMMEDETLIAPADTSFQEAVVELATIQPIELSKPVVADIEKPALTEEAALPEVYGYIIEPEADYGDIASAPANEPADRKGFGVSSILNIVMGSVDPRDEKLITFSNDEEGSIRVDFNRALAKARRID